MGQKKNPPGRPPGGFLNRWWSWGDSNPRPPQAGRALPTIGAIPVRIVEAAGHCIVFQCPTSAPTPQERSMPARSAITSAGGRSVSLALHGARSTISFRHCHTAGAVAGSPNPKDGSTRQSLIRLRASQIDGMDRASVKREKAPSPKARGKDPGNCEVLDRRLGYGASASAADRHSR